MTSLYARSRSALIAIIGLSVGVAGALVYANGSHTGALGLRGTSIAQIPAGIRLTEDACMIIPKGDEDEIYFISCGGIY